MFKTLIFALLVVSAVAFPYGSKKSKTSHAPTHSHPAPLDDHPVEVQVEPLVLVEVVVEAAVEEEPVTDAHELVPEQLFPADQHHPVEEEPLTTQEPAVEEEDAPEEAVEEPTTDTYHPSQEEAAAQEDQVAEEEPATEEETAAEQEHVPEEEQAVPESEPEHPTAEEEPVIVKYHSTKPATKKYAASKKSAH